MSNSQQKNNLFLSEKAKKQHQNKNIGMYGKKHSEETKRKMSENAPSDRPWQLGRTYSEETIKKLRQANLGKILSVEHKEKIKQNHHNVSGENNPMYGKKHSEETKRKISEKRKLRNV